MPTNSIERAKIAQTTSFQNNCLLNCFVPTIIEAITKCDPVPEDPSIVSIFSWLSAFRTFYEMGTEVTDKDLLLKLKELFTNTYTDPRDQEAILGPVLRVFLGSLLQEQEQINEYFEGVALGNETVEKYGFLPAITQFLLAQTPETKQKVVQDFPGILGAAQHREALEKAYVDFCSQQRIESANMESLQSFMQCRTEKGKTVAVALLDIWQETAGKEYANYVQTPLNFLGIGSVVPLALNLGVTIEAYSMTSDAYLLFNAIKQQDTTSTTGQSTVSTIKVVYDSAHPEHWQHEMASEEDAREHNRHYNEANRSQFYPGLASDTNPLKTLKIAVKAKLTQQSQQHTSAKAPAVSSQSTAVTTTQPQTTSLAPDRERTKSIDSTKIENMIKTLKGIDKLSKQMLNTPSSLEEKKEIFQTLHRVSEKANKENKIDTTGLSEKQKEYLRDYYNQDHSEEIEVDPATPQETAKQIKDDHSLAENLQELEILTRYRP